MERTATQWIFQIKHIIYVVLAAASIYHIKGIQKNLKYLNNMLIMLTFAFTAAICLIRTVNNLVLRFFIISVALGLLNHYFKFEWSTLSLVSVMAMY